MSLALNTLLKQTMTPHLCDLRSNTHYLQRIAETLLMLLPLGYLISSAVCDICISGIAMCFLIQSILKRDYHWLSQPWLQASCLFWIYLCITSRWAINPSSALVESLTFARFPILTAALANWLLCSPINHQRLQQSVVLFAFFTCFDIFIQYITGVDLIGRHAEGVGANASLMNPELFFNVDHFRRLTGLSNKWNIAGKLTLLAMPVMTLTAYQASHTSNTLYRILLLTLTALLATSIMITGERTPIIVIGLSGMLSYALIPTIRRFIITSVCLTSAITGLILISNPSLQTRVTAHMYSVAQVTVLDWKGDTKISTSHAPLNDHGAIYYRLLINNSWQLFLNHPIIGIGIKQMPETCQKEIPDNADINFHGQSKFCPTSPANLYLELLANTGIIGFVLFTIIVSQWFRVLSHLRDDLKKQPNADTVFMLGLFVIWLMQFFPIMINSSIFFAWHGIKIWWPIGWLMGFSNRRDSS